MHGSNKGQSYGRYGLDGIRIGWRWRKELGAGAGGLGSGEQGEAHTAGKKSMRKTMLKKEKTQQGLAPEQMRVADGDGDNLGFQAKEKEVVLGVCRWVMSCIPLAGSEVRVDIQVETSCCSLGTWDWKPGERLALEQ